MVEPQPPAAVSARFDAIVVPEIPVLWRAALAITGDPHDAEDLMQDTLLRAYRFLDGFDGAHPRAWLLTVMRNTQINRSRRRRPSLLTSGEIDEPSAGAPSAESAEDTATRDHLDARIEAALDTLSPKLATVINLVDVAGCTYDEAAAALGIPGGTVMSRLHRARRRIRAELGHHPDLGGQR
jgi:RNA polymerase sigma-70 factor (ECF subfamily)